VGIGARGRLTFRRESSWKGRRLGDWAYHQEANAAGRGVQPWGSRRGQERSRKERNKIGRREVIMARCGAHQGGEYKGINTVSSVIDRGELGFGQGNRTGSTLRVGIGAR